MKDFDSFVLPPPNKKGVKPIQKAGPYLRGTGPRYVHQSREEILGEPLTSEEVKELVSGCLKSERQLNMGRDGLTHNMLDNIHAHWKRQRVCKINAREFVRSIWTMCERTGGKVIFRRGGVLFLFRGRNYNYKTRPRFPLMLWKPVTPVYPQLIQCVPEGLTVEEATEMRKKGRKLMPIRKLAKNGVYADLELVPCVLISLEDEHILMWRGQNWKSSFGEPAFNSGIEKSNAASATSTTGQLEGQEVSPPCVQTASTGPPVISSQDISIEQRESSVENDRKNAALDAKPAIMQAIEKTLDRIDYTSDESESQGNTSGSATVFGDIKCADDGESESMSKTYGLEPILDSSGIGNEEPVAMPLESYDMPRSPENSVSHPESSFMDSLYHDKLEDVAESSQDINAQQD
ncbi:hypothetical protein CRYUN_Cryun33cG0056500 [Craigia yunnanensis]